jgi:transposase InsO family protein
LFGISRQVYYRSINNRNKGLVKAEKVISLVKEIRTRMPRLGARKLYNILYDQLEIIKVGRDKFFRILSANHLLVKPTRSYRKTTNTHHRFKKHKDLVSNLKPERPEQIWVSDITYLGGRRKELYLALVTDAYSKKIVGFNLSNSLNASGAISALKMGIKERIYSNEQLIHHSDKGIQYCCEEYQNVLKNNRILCSMTQNYDPYSNAIAERVNGIIKGEFQLEEIDCEFDVMQKIVKQSIEIYNNERPHFSCNYFTPKQMHLQQSVEIKTYKKAKPAECLTADS